MSPDALAIVLHASDSPSQSRLQLLRHPIRPVPAALIVDHIRHRHQPGLPRPAPPEGAPTASIADGVARKPPHLCRFLGRHHGIQTVKIISFVHMHSLQQDKGKFKPPLRAHKRVLSDIDILQQRIAALDFYRLANAYITQRSIKMSNRKTGVRHTSTRSCTAPSNPGRCPAHGGYPCRRDWRRSGG
jgi:hypothetical protein